MSADAEGGQEADAHHIKSPVRCAEGRISRRTGAAGSSELTGADPPNRDEGAREARSAAPAGRCDADFGKAKSGSFVPNATRFDDTQGEEDRRTP
jgi:hypothetical protein